MTLPSLEKPRTHSTKPLIIAAIAGNNDFDRHNGRQGVRAHARTGPVRFNRT